MRSGVLPDPFVGAGPPKRWLTAGERELVAALLAGDPVKATSPAATSGWPSGCSIFGPCWPALRRDRP